MFSEVEPENVEHESLLGENAEDEAPAYRNQALCVLVLLCVGLLSMWLVGRSSSTSGDSGWNLGARSASAAQLSLATSVKQTRGTTPTHRLGQADSRNHDDTLCHYQATQVIAGAIPTCTVGQSYNIGRVCELNFPKHACESTRCVQGVGMDAGHGRFTREVPICVRLPSEPALPAIEPFGGSSCASGKNCSSVVGVTRGHFNNRKQWELAGMDGGCKLLADDQMLTH